MDLINRMENLALKVSKQLKHTKTEEATKNAFVMPFIDALGYGVFNPSEVIPEFTADIGTKKGEKVDYAIKKDNEIIILIECKWSGTKLDKSHTYQLQRYFSVTDAKFAILTNGIRYEFYSDTDQPNKMDSKPFFVFNINNFRKRHVDELKKFTKEAFSYEKISKSASTLKYQAEVKKILAEELENPSTDFLKFFASKISGFRLNKSFIEAFTNIVKDAGEQFIHEIIDDRLKTAMKHNEEIISEDKTEKDEKTSALLKESKTKTTQEEIDGYNIVRAILRKNIDVKRVAIRDVISYCGILLDDTNRKPICRLHFNSSKKALSLFADEDEKRVNIDSVDDIFNYAGLIREAVAKYDNPAE